MADRLIRRVGLALIAMGAIAALLSAAHGTSNVAALVAVAAGTAFITISYDNPEEGN
ncbi:hypothetical protein [Actinomyces procaprae]|uniref:hypothetical protein n=1 Tax=Actinomyces procaprae TaxID=2560010 RepID=UPI00144895FD|nr:hypothetical protein [Actinomyces procaprae]